MLKLFQNLILTINFILLRFSTTVNAEPIFQEKYQPSGTGPFPVVIALHTSGGCKSDEKQLKYLKRLGMPFTPHGSKHIV